MPRSTYICRHTVLTNIGRARLNAPEKIINFTISDFRFQKMINFTISDMTMVNDKVVAWEQDSRIKVTQELLLLLLLLLLLPLLLLMFFFPG